MACPFFIPTERADDLALPHPARLPLGTAWRGTCGVPGHKEDVLGNLELESCNLGYAKSCARLPARRSCDAVRFGVVKESPVSVSLEVVFEAQHRPAGHEFLAFEVMSNTWSQPVSDRRVQLQAECFLRAYLERKVGADRTLATQSTENREETTEPQ